MSLLDDDDIDVPLQPDTLSPIQSEDNLGHVATNPLSLLDEDPVVLANNYSGGNVESSSMGHIATLPRSKGPPVHSKSGGDVLTETTPVKHSKLTKFMAGRKKASKGSIHGKKGSAPSPPPSPKIATKGQGSSEQNKSGKHHYSTLKDDVDPRVGYGLLRDSPDSPERTTFHTQPATQPATQPITQPAPHPVSPPGGNVGPLFPLEPFSNSQGSVSSVGDVGSELTSPVSGSVVFSPSPPQTTQTSTPQPLQSISRPGRQSQLQTASVSGFTQGTSSSGGVVTPGRIPPPPNTSQPTSQSDDRLASRVKPSVGSQQPLASETTPPVSSAQHMRKNSNDPWTSSVGIGGNLGGPTASPGNSYDWAIPDDLRQKFVKQFNDLYPESGLLKGEKARQFFVKSKLPNQELSQIWKLSDVDEDNALSEDEFCIAMKLVVARRKGITIPPTLPDVLRLKSSAAQENVTSSGGQGDRQEQHTTTGKSWARFSPTGISSGTTPPPPTISDKSLPPPPQPVRKAPRPPKLANEDSTIQGEDGGQSRSVSSPPAIESLRERGSMKHQRSKSSFASTGTTHEAIKIEKDIRRRSDIITDTDNILSSNTDPGKQDQNSVHKEMQPSSAGQLVELDSQGDLPFPTDDIQASSEVVVEPLYTAVVKPKKNKKPDKLVHFDNPGLETTDDKVSHSGSTDGEPTSPTSSKTEAAVKRKPKRAPPPRPTPFAEHRRRVSSPEQEVQTAIPSHYETAPLVDVADEDMGVYETVDAPLIAKTKSKPPVQPKPTISKPAPAAPKPKPQGGPKPTGKENKAKDPKVKDKDKDKDTGVRLPGLERNDGGSDEFVSILEAMKARGHTRTSSLDSKKKAIASTAEYQNLVSITPEYQNLVEGLPPAIPPAPPPKPKKKDHLEEPPRQSGGRLLSRSASLDSINSLSSHTGTATSPVPIQKSEWKEPPQVSPRTKKKPLPLPSTKDHLSSERPPLPGPTSALQGQLPIQPVRRTVKSTETSKTPSKPSMSSDTQAETKSTSRHQPVAAPDKSFNKVVQELELKRSPSPVKPPAHKSGVGSHGADVLSVAIAIAEKASVLPSSTQMSGLRDKAVVQQAIRTLKEEISTLKTTNSELQSQLTMLMEERNRLRLKSGVTK